MLSSHGETGKEESNPTPKKEQDSCTPTAKHCGSTTRPE